MIWLVVILALLVVIALLARSRMRPAAPEPQRRPLGPDDDQEFLWSIGDKIRRDAQRKEDDTDGENGPGSIEPRR